MNTESKKRYLAVTRVLVLIKVMVWLRNKVKGSNSIVFFYYSGHGAPDVNRDTEAYIVPYDR